MMVGATIWGKISDIYGRKFSLTLSSFCIFYFGSLTSVSPNYTWLLILRALTGFAVAGAAQTVTAVNEFLPIQYRGPGLNAMGKFFSVGTFITSGLALIIMPTLGWRCLIFFCSLPSLLFIFFSYWFPESPRYCSIAGKSTSVRETMEKVAKWNRKTLPEGVFCVEARPERGQFKDLFHEDYVASTALLWIIWILQAFLFYGMILFTTEIYHQLAVTDEDKCIGDLQEEKWVKGCVAKCGKLETDDYRDVLITTSAEFFAVLMAIASAELIGRRRTMSLFYVLFCVFVACTGMCVPRTFLTVFLSLSRGLCVGAGSVVVTYTNELYPTKIRSLGLGCSIAISRVGAVLTPFAAQPLLDLNFRAAIGVYTAAGAIVGLCSLLLPIETKGRILQDE